ncbi:sialin [Antennarius striatus]|uniref:sialin n=1 Tax=Antennarius striatus TaxID=241820 RepID=UPI0035B47B41
MPLPNGYSINSAREDEIEDDEPLIENAVPSKCCSVRLGLAILMFFGFVAVYALRVNLSVAMIAMVNSTDPNPAKNSSKSYDCPLSPDLTNNSDGFQYPEGIPRYPWDSETQGWLLGAFFFGYLCTQIPGGYLAGHYGGSIFLGVGVLGTAVLTLFTPLAAQMGPHWLFALRALEGFGEGITFPAMMALWSRWAPPLERSGLMTLTASGSNFGAFLSLPLTAYICQTLGWPSVFYICGGAGCLWSVFWFSLVSDDPRTHRRISQEERDYIINSIGHQGTGHGWSLPLLSIMMSVPMWIIIITQMCANWSYYTLLTSLPTYMDSILHFDLKSNGFLSALPYLGGWLMAIVSGFLADYMIRRKIFSLTVVRKLFTAVGLLSSAGFLLGVAYVGCSHIYTITLLTLSTTIGATAATGVFINQMDIAPRYSGILLGITNTFGTIPGVLAPIATGYFTEDHTLAGWRKVFWVSGGINIFGALIYILFATAKIQTWAITEEEKEEVEKECSSSISA